MHIQRLRMLQQLLLYFLKIQEKIQNFQRVSGIFVNFSNSLIYESRLAIEDTFDHMSDFTCHDLVKAAGDFSWKSKRLKSKEIIQNFQHNINLLALEERKEQDEFAHAVEQALKVINQAFTSSDGVRKDPWFTSSFRSNEQANLGDGSYDSIRD